VIFANGVRVAGSALLTMCMTGTPRASRWSATIRRWQRHHTASAHMIATGVRFAIASSSSTPASNSGVSAWSAKLRNALFSQASFASAGGSFDLPRRPPSAGIAV
jgi:hypothetical protein